MAKYLVTGGAGFIGSHLCDELIKKNTVYVLDNLSAGNKDNLPKKVEFIKGDVCNYTLVEELMREIDGCFHLAAMVSVPLCNEDLVNTHNTNLTGTLNILESSRVQTKDAKPIPIVFASSSAVYGDTKMLPINEDSETEPISMYGATKLCSEFYGHFFNELYHIPFTALRLFNVYGTRQNLTSMYAGVITIFLNEILHDKPCIFYGDGLQSRDFIYVRDVVRFFIHAMNTSTQLNRTYNVCTGNSTTIKNIAKLLGETLNKATKVEYRPARVGDIRNSLGNPTLAQRELGIIAETPIELGLKYFSQDMTKLLGIM